jgi:NAD(P)-dependent dehydrogenase (short-subunit alcohol dehydrogenase family)
MEKNMAGRIEGRIAIVTGAARGIGLAIAARFAREGAGVLMCDIDRNILDEAVAPLLAEGLDILSCHCDVADTASIAAMVEAGAARWKRIDILVNNAAISDDTPIGDLTDQRWREVLAINLDSVLNCTRSVLPYMQSGSRSCIVNISSVQGLRGQPHAMAYATAKAGVINLTRCMAVDFGPMGIRVNAIAPGYIDTRMALQKQDGTHEHQTEWYQDIYVKHGRMPLRRAGTPQDVEGPVLFLASDDSLYITGEVIVVDGGFMCTY